MNEESKKNNKSKTIVMIVLFLTVSSLGVYYMYSKYNNKSKANENGSAISGYILEDGAEPGLSDD